MKDGEDYTPGSQQEKARTINGKSLAVRVTVALLLAPVGGIIGYYAAKLAEKGLTKKPESQSEEDLEIYNRAVRAYNAGIVDFNQALETRLELFPVLRMKELVEQIDQKRFNEEFNRIMREEF